ncbi:MAG TPA: chromosomal replication initiator protein DnaA [Verrucomicrobiae bacterium]|nr:chromosomal replication initiator protein DnaA [Verrucomicrobiae bacterium]
MKEQLEEVWASISVELRQRIPADAFARWFASARLLDIGEKGVRIGVANTIYQIWIEENFLVPLKESLVAVLGHLPAIQFQVTEGRSKDLPSPLTEEPEGAHNGRHSGVIGLNAGYDFESYVVGSSNELAHAAAQAVATAPGKTYNPLFIHGGVGLGKTHLMHAIGNAVVRRGKTPKVCYVTSEQFTNEFIDALQKNALPRFRRKYRSLDVLLIDDVQFLGGKERTQEEFFHTFNSLFDGRKQIVLTSDRCASDMRDLEERLVSRFEWGLSAELMPPDIETRIAILRKKLASMEVSIGDDVLNFMARHITNNVRRLEGALLRVAAYASLSGKSPTVEAMEPKLRDLIQEEQRRNVSIEAIQKRVAEVFDLRPSDMTSKKRPASIARPRQIAMYLARRLTKSSLQEIGAAFGGRDHGTVLHACGAVAERMAADLPLRQKVEFLEKELKGTQAA